ncbi:tRNA uridine-5-carboxymethylaminomethyl(34) synthesis GTPase MnmE [Qiania dongpingensis]|uniref:tRNA modification GTPase MnmE n=1 Tax=Qiania dongpingensis TaxID=2763669 RepID=A0A7G9G102_9FIRM|nr:tRNA uridine-5-carboxymethylaminomethyl(34) synthesis GTPase MnmE [Qiania dongpingensis]QNM04484.1 tRNA uridine-5-carboxymethylaminomethyl(34) synthesis GTPase MnmE [Qiania dongpingensis]
MNAANTIAAIATAMSSSGIGIVRISGDEALEILSRVFYPARKDYNVMELKSHTVIYGHIYDGDTLIDEVLVLYMKRPHSYTAEDTVEIDCHGGVLVVKKVLEAVLKNGARPAEAGEFTKRAFLNGRIDLSQAEAVMELIDSKNEYAMKSSLKQLKGSLSEKIISLRERILYEIAFIESALDDPENISLEGYGERLKEAVDAMKKEVDDLIQSADNGRMVSEGIKTVILGKPNAGKSSVLNLLIGEDRAIVTEIAGTTRDTLEEHMMLNGISLNIMDTAGIRSTDDIVEKIGVKRAMDHAEDADLILYVVDSSESLTEDDERIIQIIQNKHAIVLLNKSDLNPILLKEEMERKTGKQVILFSAKKEEGLDELSEAITDLFFSGNLDFNDEIYITSARQKNALLKASESFSQVNESLENHMPEDFYSIDLMDAYEALGMIIGEAVEDDLVNEIFSRFCMGK